MKANIGGHFDPAGSSFICEYPGIYVFTVHLYKSYSDSKAACDILVNGNTTITAYTMPAFQQGLFYLYEAGNTVVLQLKYGDVVSVGNCEQGSGLNGYSSFSGFLIKAY